MATGTGEREITLEAPTYPDLAGMVAVVTGGSGGTGAATCRDETKIGAVVDVIRCAGGEALGVPADCTDFSAVQAVRKSRWRI